MSKKKDLGILFIGNSHPVRSQDGSAEIYREIRRAADRIRGTAGSVECFSESGKIHTEKAPGLSGRQGES